MTSRGFRLLLAVMFVVSIAWFLLLLGIFVLVTVRPLRRHPETRGCLGFHILPGSDALNVAEALSWPRWVTRKLDAAPVRACSRMPKACIDTRLRESACARICYGAQLLSVAILMLGAAIEKWG